MDETIEESLLTDSECRAMLGIIVGILGTGAEITKWHLETTVKFPDGHMEERNANGGADHADN